MLRYILIVPQIEVVGYYWQRFFVACLGIFFSFFIIKKGYSKNIEYKLLKLYLIPYTIIILISIFCTYYNYNYNIKSIIFASTPYLYIYISFSIIYIINKTSNKINEFKIISIVITLQFIMLIIKTYGWYIYNIKKGTFLSAIVTEAGDWIRNGYQRIYGGQLLGLAFVFIIYKFYIPQIGKWKKGIYICGIVSSICFVMFITQGKFQTLVLISTLIVMYYFTKSGVLEKTRLILVFFIGAIIFAFSSYADKFMDMFTITGNRGAGNMARLQTIEHYFNLLNNGKWLYGLGLLDDSNITAHNIMKMNEWRLYYLDDIGILGGIARFGVMAVFIYGWFIILGFRTIHLTIKIKNYGYCLLSIGICSYFIISNIMINIFEQANAFSIPFFIAILSYIYGKSRLSFKRRNVIDSCNN